MKANRVTGYEPTPSRAGRIAWLILAGLVAIGAANLLADLARMVQP